MRKSTWTLCSIRRVYARWGRAVSELPLLNFLPASWTFLMSENPFEWIISLTFFRTIGTCGCYLNSSTAAAPSRLCKISPRLVAGGLRLLSCFCWRHFFSSCGGFSWHFPGFRFMWVGAKWSVASVKPASAIFHLSPAPQLYRSLCENESWTPWRNQLDTISRNPLTVWVKMKTRQPIVKMSAIVNFSFFLLTNENIFTSSWLHL